MTPAYPEYDGFMDTRRIIIKLTPYTPVGDRKVVRKSNYGKGWVMALIGYARVSTHEQTLDLQRDALQAAGVKDIYEDQLSGKNTEREELRHCLKALRDGDTLVVWRLDRLGRSLADLIALVSELERRRVGVLSLKESIDTTGPAGKLVFHLFAALAEFERELVRERTLAGLAAARARGRKGGRPRTLSATKERAALAMMKNRDLPVVEIARHFGVSRSTLYELAAASRSESAQDQGGLT